MWLETRVWKPGSERHFLRPRHSSEGKCFSDPDLWTRIYARGEMLLWGNPGQRGISSDPGTRPRGKCFSDPGLFTPGEILL